MGRVYFTYKKDNKLKVTNVRKCNTSGSVMGDIVAWNINPVHDLDEFQSIISKVDDEKRPVSQVLNSSKTRW